MMQHTPQFSKAANDEWAQAFSKQQESISVDAQTTDDALSKTAGVLADIVGKSDNPKFKESKFLEMMEQLRDKELAIEGDKLVNQLEPSSHDMAQEFLKTQGQPGVSASAWEEDFSQQGSSSQAHAPPRNYQGQQFSSDVSHDLDWVNHKRDLDSQKEKELMETDWYLRMKFMLGLHSSKNK